MFWTIGIILNKNRFLGLYVKCIKVILLSFVVVPRLKPNGPAIKLVGVT